MTYKKKEIALAKVDSPKSRFNQTHFPLKRETMEKRKEQVLAAMEAENWDILVIYADREHGANFEYFTGFIPRFEEALLVIGRNGNNQLLLGNENLKLGKLSRIKAETVHIPHFSLPNQPMDRKGSFEELITPLREWGGKRVGLIGWKNFTSQYDDNQLLFDMPYYIVDTLKNLVGEKGQIRNAASLLIGAESGIRTLNNADEVRYYEFCASLASDVVLEGMNALEVGKTEMEVASKLSAYGQPNTVTTIMAAGERFVDGVIYPRTKEIALGDNISMTVGYKGGLTSRAGYAVSKTEELAPEVSDYLERLAMPYYSGVVAWLENARIGLTGDEMYQLIERVLPQKEFHWELNPGHFTGDEEWLSSPMYLGSQVTLKSGMIFQVDIIPSVPGYAGTSAETGVAIGDASLRKELAEQFPEFWQRIVERREFIKEQLNIILPEEILPLSDTVGYYRPYLLAKEYALKVNG